MKRLVLCLLGCGVIASAAFAGVGYSGKEIKQVAAPPPCPQWYADNEFNVGLWGTYVFTGNEWANDRYIEADHAWGGGGDLKYFFHRYFGVGIEGWAVSARQALGLDVTEFLPFGPERISVIHENNVIGAILGTFTFRYPIPCSRWSPYAFAGGGGIFGGGKRQFRLTFVDSSNGEVLATETVTKDSESRAIGQFGGGIEFRFTPHIGWVNDFSWNVIDGPHNNFGMVRSGLNFAF
jgi:hypothetical protein